MKQNKLNELYDLMEKAQSGLEEIRRELKEQSESKPEFKVGDWVVVMPEDLHFYNSNMGDPQKIDSILESGARFMLKSADGCKRSYDKIRLATESEVKEHLIAEAKKKGFVDGFDLSRVDVGKGYDYAGELDYKFWAYSLKDDELTNSGAQIYKQGIWATIKEEELVIDGHKVELDGVIVKVGCKRKYIPMVKEIYKQIYWFNNTVTGGCRITALTIDDSNEITVEQLKQIVDYIKKYER